MSLLYTWYLDPEALADTSRCIQVLAEPERKRSSIMLTNTRCTAKDLMHLVDAPEKLLCGNSAGPSNAAMTEDVGEVRPTGHEGTTSEVVSSMGQALAAAKAEKDEKEAGASGAQTQTKNGMESLKTVTKASEIAISDINMALEKLDGCVIDMAEQTIIDSLEESASYHNKASVRQAIGSALRGLLASILENDNGFCDIFEVVVAQVVGTSSPEREVAKVLVSNPAILAPISTYVVKTADKAESQALKPEHNAAPHSPPLYGSDSSSSES